jgi:flagellar biosynthesis protein FlhF
MFVKKFEAESIEGALEKVKRELGPNALILSTQRKKDGWFHKPIVEVTAATERKENPASPKSDESKMAESKLEEIFPHRKADPQSRNRKYIDIEGETGDTKAKRTSASRYEESFLKLGISQDYARELSLRLASDYPKSELQVVTFLEKAKNRLLSAGIRTMVPQEIVSKNTSWVAIGTAGVGKTSLLVKLALHMKNAERVPVSLISIDERKILGRSELSAYAKLIKVPFHSDLATKPTKMTLIDCPALSLKENEDTAELEKICGNGNHSVCIVLDAATRSNEMKRVVDYSLQFSPKAIAFTRLDLVSQRGAVYDILRSTKLPLLGLSESPSFKVPFRFFSPTELAAYLLSRRGRHE